MNQSTPLDTLETLIDARRNRDVETAMRCYTENAIVVAQGGAELTGQDALRTFINATLDLSLVFKERKIVQGEGVALHFSEWVLEIGDEANSIVTGKTTDVLVQQTDASWLIAIDNPWGTTIL